MTRKSTRWISLLGTLLLLVTMLPTGASFAQTPTTSRTFPETGQTVAGKFLSYWDAHGGLAQQGYPLSAEMQEKSATDGKTYTVQYFERAVFEMHPENAGSPYEILLTLLGNYEYAHRYGSAGAPDQKASTTTATTFKETGKTLGGKFRAYWDAHGGLAQQGYPITDEFQEKSLLDGKTYTVQYFERAVFELHPENAGTPFEVLLTQLGTYQNKRNYSPAGAPITIGLLTDASGGLAIYGPMLERGFALGLQYATGGTNKVRGHEIKVVTKDTASNVDTGTSLAREAIEKDGAKILVGVPSSSVALAVSGVAAQNKVVYIAGPAASPDITGKNWNPYTFRAGRTSVQDALTMGPGLIGLGKKFVQIAPDNAFGRGSAAAFYAVVKASGGTFTTNDTATDAGSIYAPADTTDFTSYINQVIDSGADVLIVTWAGTGFVPLFQQMTQLGVFDSMTVATGMGDNQTMAQGYADAVGSVGVSVYHYTLFDNPINNWLVTQHKAKYQKPPDLFTEGGFAAAQIVVQALDATDGDPSADGLIRALEGMQFDGPKGAYSIRTSDHVLLQPMALVKLVNTKDPDYKFFQLIKLFKASETAPPCAVPADQNRCGK